MQRLFFILLLLPISCYAQVTWLPDSSFNGDGIYSFKTGKEGHAISLQSDNKILIAGNDDSCYLVRLHTNGSVDSSFGNNGYARWARYSNDKHVLTEMTLQQDGKIIIIGYTDTYDLFIARFNENGELDSSFNGGYRIISSLDEEDYLPFDVVVLPDNKILVTGLLYYGGFFGSYTDLLLIRLNPDGSFDNTLSTDGQLSLNLSSEHNIPRAMEIQSDGKIVIGGYYMDGAFPEETDIYMELIRLNTDMTLDIGFSGDGVYKTKINGTNCRVMDLQITTSGKILCAGYAVSNEEEVGFLLQLNSNGTNDETFGDNGVWLASDSTSSYFRKLAIQDNKIYVTGELMNVYNNSSILLMCFNQEGVPDNTFGVNGLMILDNSNKDDVGFDLIIDPENHIVICGGFAVGSNIGEMIALRVIHGNIKPDIINIENPPIFVFPNPVSNLINLEISLPLNTTINVDLTDITGKVCNNLLQSAHYDRGIYTIALEIPESISPGNYFIHVTSEDYHYATMIFIK